MKKMSVCAVLMTVFLCSLSYAQDELKEQRTRENEVLDKAEAVIREEFGPEILSITRDFRNSSIVVKIENKEAEGAEEETEMAEQPGIPENYSMAAEVPKKYEYHPRPDRDPLHQPNPKPARSTYDKIKDRIKNLPVSAEPTGGGVIIKYKHHY